MSEMGQEKAPHSNDMNRTFAEDVTERFSRRIAELELERREYQMYTGKGEEDLDTANQIKDTKPDTSGQDQQIHVDLPTAIMASLDSQREGVMHADEELNKRQTPQQ